MKRILVVMPAMLATLGGCASSMSGLGGSESLSCKAPQGVICTSVSGVYANAANIAPRTPPLMEPAAPAMYSANAAVLSKDKPAMPSSNVMRSNPRVLRLWIAPWEDSDGDLHEESTVHVLVDNGRWLVDHVRAAPGNRIDGVAPPLPVSSDNAAAKAASETPLRSEVLPMPPNSPPALNLNPLPR
jgi:conjugal transfer pilus assembly protein TraV